MQLKPQPISFRFINTVHPSDATTPSSLSQIRSHAAKDHRARRQRSCQPTLKSDKKPKNRSRRRNQVASAVTGGVEHDATSGSIREQQGLEKIAPFHDQFAALSHGGLPARPLAPSQPRVGGNSKAWFTSMQLKCWLPFALADIGLLTTLFLSSCRSLEIMSEFQDYTSMYAAYKHQCIRSTNESLSFEKTRVSDTTIAMVMVLVSESYSLGNIEEWKVHLRACTDMITIRGGIDTLGLDGFLKEIITKSPQIYGHWS
ncbi:hypothetical protein SUNI508_11582 [Seiridium unicorne]|uniref:Uncharacterized protein n=1 Tax=Seiridium unicorne TaxID=138068 RepID=A0ABR2UHE9_9PEZI